MNTTGTAAFAAFVAAIAVATSVISPVLAETPAPPAAPAEAQAEKPKGWLMGAPDDETRFKLIQEQMRGFSATMIEVGQRYEKLYAALGDKNYELAAYHFDKINEIIELGTERRPKRKENADKIFLKKLGEPIMAELKSGDGARAWAAFTKVRESCMECHKAEKKEFLNGQALFRTTERPKE